MFVQQMSFTKLLAMILLGIKIYIAVGFLSTIPHTIPYTRVEKKIMNFFLWSTNKVDRLHKKINNSDVCIMKS
jgi:hypothetical protein